MDGDQLDLSIENVAIIFAQAIQVLARMDESEIENRKGASAIPKAVLCCEEAMLLVSAAVVLAAEMYPDLLDPETLMHALRGAGRPMPTIN